MQKSLMRFLAVGLCCLGISLSAFAQNVRISGTVVDASAQPVIGAGVTQVGTTSGVVTDFEGKYEFSVPVGATIKVEALGYNPYEFKVAQGQVVYNVTLDEEALELDDVVVVGYGTQKKKLVTGSTINVAGDLIEKQNTTSAVGALYSSVPGVNIVQANGQPGAGYTITVRGIGTNGNSKPLIVIDGVAGGNLDDLAPSDIESIDILKDAASAAIYGARAANGVVLVTTRQGKKDTKANVNFDYYYGVQAPNTNGVAPVSGAEYIELMDRTFQLQGVLEPGKHYSQVDMEKNAPVQYEWMKSGKWNGTNWFEESINKNAPVRNWNVGINGGSDASRYSLSFSKNYSEGTLGYPKPSYYDRTTIRMNSDYSLYRKGNRDIVKLGENVTLSITDSRSVAQGGQYSNAITSLLNKTPLLPVYDLDGSFYTYQCQLRDGWDLKDETNSIESASYGEKEGKGYRVQGNVYLEINPIKELRIRSQYGFRYNINFSRSYTPAYQLSGTDAEHLDDKVSQSGSISTGWTWETTVNYKKEFNDHSIEGLVGASIEGTGWGESISGSRKQTKFGTWEAASISQCESVIDSDMISISGSNTVPYNEIVSAFGRINYSYKDTYLLTLIAREDGSCNFAKGHRWGFFPSMSAGWIITNEDFMDWSKGFLNYFKIRGSWGQNGNCRISNFQYVSTVTLGGQYDFTYGLESTSTAAYPNNIPNVNLGWETSEQTDLGFDSRFFKSKLGVTFDWYRKDTKDWLVTPPQLAIMGANASNINGGAVRNSGVELSFTWNDHIGDFSYNLGLNASYNHNNVLYINSADGYIAGESKIISENVNKYQGYEARPGKPIGYFLGIASEGIFQNQAQIDEYNKNGYAFIDGYEGTKPGDTIWIDQNSDGVYDDKDCVEIGNPHPDVNMGLSISLSWKGFDFSMNGSGAFGQQVVQSYRQFVGNGFTENYTNNFINRLWTGEGSTNEFPAFHVGSDNAWKCNGYLSDIWVQDADYFKVRNITFGYDLKKAIKKLPLRSLRVYVTGQNLITITGYDGMDPEVGYGPSSWTSGFDVGFYPSPKVYQAGVSIKF
ncbi:MAG: TonB-dependent receptor [Bacteroidia bacterium]|nr:TonB-dependent receptor [Bacteroidia bacterium]